MESEKQFDVSGYEEIRSAIEHLVNQYPALNGERIPYATITEERGKAIYTLSSPVVQTERRTITGHVSQTCYYPFVVVYRASGLKESTRKIVQQWLDNLGRWLGQEPVLIDGNYVQLKEYPDLTQDRKITSISRNSPAVLDTINSDGMEVWTISLTANYNYEFDT